MKLFKRFRRQPSPPSPPIRTLTLGDWMQGEYKLEDRKTEQRIAANLLPPGAEREWVSQFATETNTEFLQRTGWIKCHACEDWFLRQVECRNCGKTNEIHATCPLCNARIKALRRNRKKCVTCSAPLDLIKTFTAKSS